MSSRVESTRDHVFRLSREDMDVAGPLEAPVILLVHGSIVTRKMWLPQLRGISDDHRVIAPDLPGHGTAARVPFSFDACLQALEAIIRDETRGRALVVGASLGGYIAIELAHRHPGLVSGVVLSGCSVNFRGLLGVYLKSVSTLMKWRLLRVSRKSAEEKTRRVFPPALGDVAEAQLRAGVFPEPLGAAFAEMAGKDFAVLLSRYGGPGLILNGEQDRPCRRGEHRFAASLNPGRVELIAGARHACSIEQPDAFNRAVLAFARSIGW